MNTFLQFISEGVKDDKVTKTFSVTASPHVMDNFERFLAYIQYCSGVGHSATVAFPIDGDGADRFSVEGIEKWDGNSEPSSSERYVEWIGFNSD